MRFSFTTLLLFVCQLLVGQWSFAHENTTGVYDRISLQASADGGVVNDLMVVRLQTIQEDRNAATLADKINTDMSWALEQLKAYPLIETRTDNYTTQPRYEKNRVVGWRSAQSLILTGSEFEQVKTALQTLQSRLQVQSMRFQPQTATRDDAEEDLIDEALDKFKSRALLVQANMGAISYRIVQLNINTSGQAVHRPNRTAASSVRSLDSAPGIEAGESRVTVTVSGQIQLQ